MGAIWPAVLVHLFTASGAVCGLFAIAAVSTGAWEAAFGWLGGALIIDGLDGTLARRAAAAARLPRFSGERRAMTNSRFAPATDSALNLAASAPGLSLMAAAHVSTRCAFIIDFLSLSLNSVLFQ